MSDEHLLCVAVYFLPQSVGRTRISGPSVKAPRLLSGLAFFCEGLDGKHLRLCTSYCISGNYSLCHRSVKAAVDNT